MKMCKGSLSTRPFAPFFSLSLSSAFLSVGSFLKPMVPPGAPAVAPSGESPLSLKELSDYSKSQTWCSFLNPPLWNGVLYPCTWVETGLVLKRWGSVVRGGGSGQPESPNIQMPPPRVHVKCTQTTGSGQVLVSCHSLAPLSHTAHRKHLSRV